MNGVIFALIGTLFTFSITTLGAFNVFFVTRKPGDDIQKVFLGFAGGVMVAASIWSLLVPGIEAANADGQISWLIVSGGFIAGVMLLLAADRFMKKKYEKMKCRSKNITLKKNTVMMILAITIHNIPEGIAVGLAFSLATQEPSNAGLMSGAIALAIGIGIQNYPEGTAVALPLIGDGMSKKKAFLTGSLSAAVEPVFGVMAAALSGFIQPALPLLLSLAAGTMIYVVVEELIPQAHMSERDTIGTLGFVVGFLLMMILDVAL